MKISCSRENILPMNCKNLPKSAFFQTTSYLILSIWAVTNTLQFARAEVSDLNITKQHPQIQLLAQFSDNQDQERSQLRQTANTLLNQGDLTGAEENFRKLIKKFPEDSFGYYQLGNVLFRQGKKEDAIKEYHKAIQKNSKYAVAYNAIAQVYASQQQWSEAIVEYNKALKINPNYGDALSNIAIALWNQGNHKEAIAYAEKAVNIFKAQNRPDRVGQIEQILRQMKTGDDPTLS
ncbi:TPR repeat-containing protein [Tolypothrix sp. NIES-4075]|nr:TPR repeat-containing protein [Tolypothrix sp. NIES-4075]